ncbi:hypothetical protein [Cryobacterium zhongshanensis]|uniref:Uncharacterized protein n=1 Tax=Cryobacterium zhongshanensis TaxID=2928153 RepID=A0AA41UGE9_9MICO|nr:hypothetical protein [Cryobacterium zhongshanensis]MCI4659663.1 hypothetical protein [Cryobacterium zhongshanensis]
MMTVSTPRFKRLSLWRLLTMRKAALEAYTAEEAATHEAWLLELRIRRARREVARITQALSPEHRQAQTEALAKWQAHLDSLLDDGVPAIMAGDE